MVVDALLNAGHDVVPIIAPRRPLTGLDQWRQLHSNAIENRRLRYECHWECDSTTVSDVSQVIPHKSKLTFSLECECLSKYVRTQVWPTRSQTHSHRERFEPIA